MGAFIIMAFALPVVVPVKIATVLLAFSILFFELSQWIEI